MTGSEGGPVVADVAAAAEAKGESSQREPPTPDLSVSAGTQDPENECPKVPSQTPYTSPTPSQMEKERNSGDLTVVPTIEETPQKQSTVGLPDLLTESFGSEQKSSESGSLSEGFEPKNSEIEEQHSVNLDKDGAKEKECSDVCGWISQGESVLPSMGILPEAEEIPAQASQPQKSQSTVSPAASAAPSAENRSPEPQHVDPSDVMHKIKKIKWQDIEVPIITQNNNGPCPLLAIVNVMILKVGYQCLEMLCIAYGDLKSL